MTIPPQLPQAMPRVSEEERAAMQKVAQQFESLFVNHLLGEMRKTVHKSGWIPESQGERVFQSL